VTPVPDFPTRVGEGEMRDLSIDQIFTGPQLGICTANQSNCSFFGLQIERLKQKFSTLAPAAESERIAK